jgi:protein-disulfide isomerase
MKINTYKLICVAMLTLMSTDIFAILDDNQKEEIGIVVRDYLIAHPEVIAEAIQALQQKESKAWIDNAKKEIIANQEEIFNSNSPGIGSDKPKVILVEFFDYNCPHCRAMHSMIQKIAAQNKDLRIIYKELPVLGETSLFAESAALASREQNKYHEFHEKLMTSDGPLSDEKVLSIAKESGVNVEKLKKDMKDPKIIQELQTVQKLAIQLGIRGTPSFVIGRSPGTKEMTIDFVPGEVTQENLIKHIKGEN